MNMASGEPKILIVDDEPANIKILVEVLGKSNYKLIGTTSGYEALESALQSNKPDLILLDIMMPEMDGFEVLKELKRNVSTQDIPIIFITSMSEDADEALGLRLGAVDYITKPFSPATVNARVRTQLELKKHRDNLETLVYERTEKLAKSNKRLREEIQVRKKAEENLRLQTTALEAAANAVLITDITGIVLWCNQAYTDLSGYEDDEVLGNSIPFLVDETQDAQFYEKMWEEISSGGVWKGRMVYQRKNGKRYTVNMTITPVRSLGDKIRQYIIIQQDITRELEMERQLIQAQKLEAIGTLTGGIAHDFNNILYAIQGYTELALNETDPEDNIYSYLDQVTKAGRRASDLVKHILTFSRNTDLERQPMEVQPIIKEVLKLLKGTLPSTIEIIENIEDSSGKILAGPTQIHQVLMNLTTNAYQSMRKTGGVLTVRMFEHRILPEETMNHPDFKPIRYVCIRVEDTGHGMDTETMEKIFEPFFSTKEVGEGTGLGLSTVHGIVKSYEGIIDVQSEIGKGTVFTVYFPIYEEEEREETEESVETGLPRGTETVMIVDDEKPITEMNEMQLESLGYRVVTHNNSLKAWETFQGSPEDFDLVITDQTMPEMTGVQLSKKMLDVRPDIPIILCTGFSEMVSREEALGLGIKEYLKKPIIYKDMAKRVREILDDSGAR